MNPGNDDHRLLQAFLRRVAASPQAEAFALRGGMLVRHWFPAMGRIALDADLLCALPFDLPQVRQHVAELLARDVGDDVRFADRFRTDVIWEDTAHPGIRLLAPARVDGRWGEVNADLTFRLLAWPHAQPTALDPDGSARLLVCAPETLIARKLTVTAEQGPRVWRPKDLADLWWMLEHGTVEIARVGEALERLETLRRWNDGPARLTFWQDPLASGRWGRFLRTHAQLDVPWDLARVVGDVRAHLAPLAAESPCR